MDYNKLAKEIHELAGGDANIESFTNCMTRLRLNVFDQDSVDYAKIEELDNVMGVVKGAQVQIIVGPGNAQRLKDAFALVSTSTSGDVIEDVDVAQQTRDKVKNLREQTAVQRGLKHIGNIFVPLIPGFIACGLITAIANIIKGLVSSGALSDSVLTNQFFLIFASLGGIIYVIMAALVGYNSSKEFGGTPVLGAIASGVVYLPALNGAEGTGTILSIGTFELVLKSGLGGVLGVIFAALVFSVIEKQLRKFIPASLDLFLVSTFTVIIGSIITILIVMPLAAVIMDGITWFLVDICLEKGGIVGGYLLSALFLPLVMVGLHQGLTPIHAELIATQGYTVLLPILAMAGAGQVGAAIAVLVKTKNNKVRQVVASGLPAGALGVGEPLIYGMSLPLVKPFITACIGAGFGGAYLALVGNVGATALGPSGLVLIPLINSGNQIHYFIALCLSYLGGFILTFFFGYNSTIDYRIDHSIEQA